MKKQPLKLEVKTRPLTDAETVATTAGAGATAPRPTPRPSGDFESYVAMPTMYVW